ncbi:hypothetical protein [Mesorhizobium sp. B2-6-2]|uniref:hypothetical protein n=1 Tax=Mesorhizobium sp. B2-6-2 TaxID=2589915 RepID=UPI00112E1E91|nr:hypothetical protein [Mesorhizobium sp. B2-6-2]TPJ82805.1 hypothetical protein FJ419_03255 [Mesorhizobium sp. B2-6-2]
MSERLRNIFRLRSPADSERAKFLSRAFGIFSEQIVSIWSGDERSPYENLGRPTIKTAEGDRGYTLDFALRERASGRVYVSEMKCEIEFQNFKFFVLERASQLEHHKKPAFEAFLGAARPTVHQTTFLKGKSIDTDGAILIWGAVAPEGRDEAIKTKGFHDVLSVEQICADLASWKCVRYAELIGRRQKWCNELFAGLLEAAPVDAPSSD